MTSATATTTATTARKTVAATRPRLAQGRGTTGGASWIPEVQGLRTVALLLVAAYHVWFGRVSGGVDVFLFVSAFLMTRSLYGRLEAGRPLRPFGYILQRFARLMPLAVVVAAATLVASIALLSRSGAGHLIDQFWASSLYFENRWLQNDLADYFATDAAVKSPFQHYWSLSVQGQVFVLWPLAFGAIWLVRRVSRIPLRPLAIGVFGAVFALGLAWSAVLTAQNQLFAYFDLGARVWEFAAGSLLALCLPWIRLGSAARAIASWVGLAGILSCGFVIPVEGTFPGFAALWPVLSAALVIASAGERTRWGADAVFAHPVLTTLGGYTYALYLIHWPVLILTLNVLRIDAADPLVGTGVLLVSAVLSFAAVHLIERPTAWLAKPRGRLPLGLNWRAGVVVAVLPALAFALVATSRGYVADRRATAFEALASADLSRLGPNAGPDELAIPGDDAIPSAWAAGNDLGWLQACPDQILPPDFPGQAGAFCQSNADVVDPAGAPRTVMLIGSSHVQQTTQMVNVVANQQGWAMRSYLMWGCQFDQDYYEPDPVEAQRCHELWTSATADIERTRPDAVLVLSSRSLDLDEERPADGLDEWVRHVTSLGVEVIALRDHPRWTTNWLDCAQRYGFESTACAPETSLAAPNPALEASMTAAGAIPLDLNPFICPDGVCAPTHGGVTVFKDAGHITATYSRALAWASAPMLHERLPWWPAQLRPQHEGDDSTSTTHEPLGSLAGGASPGAPSPTIEPLDGEPTGTLPDLPASTEPDPGLPLDGEPNGAG